MWFRAGLGTLAMASMLMGSSSVLANPFRVEVSSVDRVRQAFGIPAAVYVFGRVSGEGA